MNDKDDTTTDDAATDDSDKDAAEFGAGFKEEPETKDAEDSKESDSDSDAAGDSAKDKDDTKGDAADKDADTKDGDRGDKDAKDDKDAQAGDGEKEGKEERGDSEETPGKDEKDGDETGKDKDGKEEGKEQELSTEEKLEKRAEKLGEAAEDKFWEEMAEKRADAEEITTKPAFHTWLEDQPKAVRDKAMSAKVEPSLEVLALWDAHEKNEAEKGGEPETDVDLEKLDFDVGDGKKLTLAKAREEYGDDLVNLMVEVAKRTGVKRGKAVIEPDQELLKRMAALEEQNKEMRGQQFWNEVAELHSDARKIKRSKQFVDDWLSKQTAGVQRLYKGGEPEDVAAVIDLYKEKVAKAQQDKDADDDGKRKTKRRKLHGGGLGGSGQPSKTGSGGGDKDDFDAGWAEDGVSNT